MSRDTAQEAVRDHVLELMPKDIRAIRAAALMDLHHGPSGVEYPDGCAGYTTALDKLRSWASNEMPGELWYEDWSGCVENSKPENEQEARHFERHDIVRAVFGALVTDGGW